MQENVAFHNLYRFDFLLGQEIAQLERCRHSVGTATTGSHSPHVALRHPRSMHFIHGKCIEHVVTPDRTALNLCIDSPLDNAVRQISMSLCLSPRPQRPPMRPGAQHLAWRRSQALHVQQWPFISIGNNIEHRGSVTSVSNSKQNGHRTHDLIELQRSICTNAHTR